MKKVALLAMCGCVLLAGCAQTNWQQKLNSNLPVFGHRNWIVVADMAYPKQSRPGIETIYSGSSQIDTVKAVLAAVKQAPHVRPIVYMDKELPSVSDKDAPGVAAYRKQLNTVLAGFDVKSEPHEDIIKKLDEAAKTFNILIIKSDMTLPYTSVFLQLECGYWSADAEARLRKAMK